MNSFHGENFFWTKENATVESGRIKIKELSGAVARKEQRASKFKGRDGHQALAQTVACEVTH